MFKRILKPSKLNWKYVFGELFLIVSGILIALYINNLNETHKLKEFERKILSEIEKSLTNDFEYHFTSRINRGNEIIHSAEIVLTYLDGKLEYNDSLESHFWKMNWIIIFEPQSIPFERLKSEGIELISDEESRKMLLELYDHSYPRISYFTEDLNKWSSNRIEPYCLSNFKILTFKRGKGYKPIDLSELKESIEYRNLVVEKKSRTRNLIGRMKSTKDNIKAIINQLN